MKRSTFVRAAAICSSFGLTAPLLAAPAPSAGPSEVATQPVPSGPAASERAAAAQPDGACLRDIGAFTALMSKQGYWQGGSGYGYGYGYGDPMGVYGFGYGLPMGTVAAGSDRGYVTGRPGYEIRNLIATANILARMGEGPACEGVLAATRTVYARYAKELDDRGVPWTDRPGWQQQQVDAAQPAGAESFRTRQLLDDEVVTPADDTLGSVYDIVMNPQTGKIAFVVMSRGGLFGIDASYTPVPWADFKVAPNASLLVLDSTRAVLQAAPQGSGDQFTRAGRFETESAKVDAYWTAHLTPAPAKD